MNFIGEFFSHWERILFAVTFVTATYFFVKYAISVFVDKVITPLKEQASDLWDGIVSETSRKKSIRVDELKKDIDSLIGMLDAFYDKWVVNKQETAEVMESLRLRDARKFRQLTIAKFAEIRAKMNLVCQFASFIETTYNAGNLNEIMLKDIDQLNNPYGSASTTKTTPVQVIQTVGSTPPPQSPGYTVPQQPGYTRTGETIQQLYNRIEASPATSTWEILLYKFNPTSGKYDTFDRVQWEPQQTALQLAKLLLQGKDVIEMDTKELRRFALTGEVR